MTILLSATLQSDLNWTSARTLAQNTEGPLLWEFDFGFTHAWEDSAHFFSYALALEQFVKTLCQEFKERSTGVILYRGSADIFLRSAQDVVVGASIFADYLHRLASFLPEELTPFCLFEGAHTFIPAKFLQLTSKDRFWHIELSLTAQEELPVAFLLPTDEFCTEEVVLKIDELLQKETYRIIPEERLTEMWHGLDEIVVMEETLSPRGKRQIKGFLAAGGKVRSRGI